MNEGTDTSGTHCALLPHEVFGRLHAEAKDLFHTVMTGGESHLAAWWSAAADGSTWYTEHPVIAAVGPLQRVPLGIHGDDAGAHGDEKILVVTWGSVATELATLDTRVLFCMAKGSDMVTHASLMTLWQVRCMRARCVYSLHAWSIYSMICMRLLGLGLEFSLPRGRGVPGRGPHGEALWPRPPPGSGKAGGQTPHHRGAPRLLGRASGRLEVFERDPLSQTLLQHPQHLPLVFGERSPAPAGWRRRPAKAGGPSKKPVTTGCVAAGPATAGGPSNSFAARPATAGGLAVTTGGGRLAMRDPGGGGNAKQPVTTG